MWHDQKIVMRALNSITSGECEFLIDRLIDAAISRHSSKVAICCDGRELTFADVGGAADRYGAAQQQLGLQLGDRVAVMLPNLPEFAVACIGNLRAGFVQVNVNPNYTRPELLHQLLDSGAVAIVLHARLLELFLSLYKETRVRTALIVGVADGAVNAALATPHPGLAIQMWDQALDVTEPAAFVRAEPGPHRIFLFQYTGGTTGKSKAAVLTVQNLSANVMQFYISSNGLISAEHNIVVTSLPLYHIFGLSINFLSCFVAGFTNLLISDGRDVNSIIAAMKRYPFTFITGVNTTFDVLTAHPEFSTVDFSSMRLAMGGGTQILPATSAKWQAITGHPVKIGYGLSETSPLVTMQPVMENTFVADIGVVCPMTAIRIIDEADHDVPDGEAGELCVHGPQVMRGYHNDERHHELTFFENRYFRTGDIVRRTTDGRLAIVDRKKDMIIVSGFNVYPNEVEAVATLHRAVKEAMCVGVPDTRTGEAVKIYLVLASDQAFERESFIEFCKERLAAYKVPRQIEIVSSVPKSAVGKPLRRLLRS